MRLVTWNTQWRFGDWEPRQELLQSILVEQRASVVLLQETWPDQAKMLADACGLQVLGFGGGYFDQTLSTVATDERFGNAILAGAGELLVDAPFDSPGDPAPRHLLGAIVDGVLVASVHLSHLRDSGEVRSRQLKHIVSLLAAAADGSTDSGRFVLAGDCNLVPNSDEHRTAVELGLVDSWPRLHPADHGATMVPVNPEITYTSWMNDRNGPSVPPDTGVRLDYVWTSVPGLVTNIERFGSHPGPRWPSDHLGLVAEVLL